MWEASAWGETHDTEGIMYPGILLTMVKVAAMAPFKWILVGLGHLNIAVYY